MRAQQRALLARKEEEDAKKAASQRLSAPLLHGGGGGGGRGAGGEGAQQVSETSTGGGGASRKIYPKLPTIPRRTRPITEAVPGDMAVQIVRASPVFTNTGQQVTGPSQRNVQINKQIIDCQNSTHLCALINGHAAEFNPVNVATGFRKLLQSRQMDLSSGVGERALQALEAAALRTIDTFEAQPVANILHIIAKTRYSPRDQSLVLIDPSHSWRGGRRRWRARSTRRECQTRCGRMRRWGGSPGRA